MESNVDNFEVVTNQLIEHIKEVFNKHSDCKCEVYSGEYLKSVSISNRFRDVQIDFDKIIPASMYLDQTVRLQVRVKRDNWLDLVIALSVDDEDIVPTVLQALDKYFTLRVDSVVEDLYMLNLCKFTKGVKENVEI